MVVYVLQTEVVTFTILTPDITGLLKVLTEILLGNSELTPTLNRVSELTSELEGDSELTPTLNRVSELI